MRERITLFLIIAVLLFGGYYAYNHYAAGLYYLAGQYDRMMNPYGTDPDAPEPTAADRHLHQSMFIVDLHADTLKWERDLLERSMFGHADVPRLREGNVALQGFTIVTKSPLRMPWSDSLSARSPDTNTLLSFLQGRPMFSLRERAYYQIDRYHDAVARARAGEGEGTELRLILDFADLEALVADREAGKDVIGGFLGIEGGHWIGGTGSSRADVEEEIQALFDAGVRMFAPTHRFDNALSGSNEGYARYGLTEHGRIALAKAESLGITVDLAHISSDGLSDAGDLLDQPFVISHTGVRANCEPPCRPDRNLSDDDIRVVLANDGVVGVGYWPQAIGPSVWRIADTMAHIMQLGRDAGLSDPSRHVALGSDYDGSVTPLIEVSNLDVLTAVLRQRPDPFTEQDVRNIAGQNACRVLATNLPGGSAERAEDLCANLRATERDPAAATAGRAGLAGAESPAPARAHTGWLVTDLIGWLARTQSEMNHSLRGQLQAASQSGAAAPIIILIGFLYGLFHAAGPGHGKVVISAWYLANPGRWPSALLASSGIALLQALSAIVTVTLILWVLGSTVTRLLDQAAAIEAIAYGLLALLGLTLLARAIIGGVRSPCCHGDEPPTAGRGLLAMVVAVGVRPCSGALGLLLFTLAVGLFPVGIAATLAMALGTALTLSFFATGSQWLRGATVASVTRSRWGDLLARHAHTVRALVQGTGGLIIATTGTLMLTAAVLRMGVL